MTLLAPSSRGRAIARSVCVTWNRKRYPLSRLLLPSGIRYAGGLAKSSQVVESSDGTKTGTVQVNAPTVFNNGMNTGIWVRHQTQSR